MGYASLQREQGAKKRTNFHQRKNQTGIPDNMKCRYEELSGVSFDDVRVHYYSDKPSQLQALAYTQGNQVYISPGQERHLPHELGHVVQQKRGLVKANRIINGVPVNDDADLEKAAAAFAEQSLSGRQGTKPPDGQENEILGIQEPVVQRVELPKELGKEDKDSICKYYSGYGEKIINKINELLWDYKASVVQEGIDKNRQYECLAGLWNILHNQIKDCVGDCNSVTLKQLSNNVGLEVFNHINDSENIGKAIGFEASNIVFVTKNEEGKIGSIYFNNGKRIRLTHDHGPKVSESEIDRRYSVYNNRSIHASFQIFCHMETREEKQMSDFLLAVGYQDLTGKGSLASSDLITYEMDNRWRYRLINKGFLLPKGAKDPRYWKAPTKKILDAHGIQRAFKKFVKQENDQKMLDDFMFALGAQTAEAGSGGRLFETRGTTSHLSRGGPEALGIELTDEEINVLYKVAQLGDNCILLEYMQKYSNLKKIPVNMLIDNDLGSGSGKS